MPKKKNPINDSGLRRLAEERLRAETAKRPAPRTEVESQKLVHELAVHQIELEMQNEELRQAQAELEISRNKFAELFDFAPIGYFTLDSQGLIREINLAGTILLGRERQGLTGMPFSRFIADEEGRGIFSRHLEAVRREPGIQKCEISLVGKAGNSPYFHLQSIAVGSPECADRAVFSSLVDNTADRELRVERKRAHEILESVVAERTRELRVANEQLRLEIVERQSAEEGLRKALAEIKEIKNRIREENIHLRQELAQETRFDEIIGQSNALSYVFYRVEQVAPQDTTVLLLGETGTGKGLIARAIHARSARKDRPMITVNCTALPGNLIESELFGREKGAFTGAHARQMGRFELADGGTIFLDEVGEMPMELQVKLLRVIQDGEFERLGNPRTIKVDVRIIAASNRVLEDEIRAGRFREDLFYRLGVFPITIPPLRQRPDDIPLLVQHFVAKFNKKIGKKVETIPPKALKELQEYHWPGNVRELESVIERAVITSQGKSLQVLDRFDTSRKSADRQEQEVKALAEMEREHILQALRKTHWRVDGKDGAALLLGLNPSTLRARMRKYGIRRP